MQDIHDMVMRVQIAMHGGYEVNTQGDSFEIALPTVQVLLPQKVASLALYSHEGQTAFFFLRIAGSPRVSGASASSV